MPIAVFDSVTGKTWTGPGLLHLDLIAMAAQESNLEHIPGNHRWVCGLLDEDGQFVTALRSKQKT
jgi:hypothetical protein